MDYRVKPEPGSDEEGSAISLDPDTR